MAAEDRGGGGGTDGGGRRPSAAGRRRRRAFFLVVAVVSLLNHHHLADAASDDSTRWGGDDDPWRAPGLVQTAESGTGTADTALPWRRPTNAAYPRRRRRTELDPDGRFAANSSWKRRST